MDRRTEFVRFTKKTGERERERERERVREKTTVDNRQVDKFIYMDY